ncbi:MAG: hypothetical protein ABI622_04065 [Chloroflexota bacterium]
MRSIELFAAVLAAVLGWAGIGLLLLGPATAAASLSMEPGGTATATASTCSLLQAGVPALLAIQLVAAAIGFAGLVAGAWLQARGDRQARRVVAIAALPPVLASVINPTAAAYLVPGAAVAVIAAVIALWPEGRRTAG